MLMHILYSMSGLLKWLSTANPRLKGEHPRPTTFGLPDPNQRRSYGGTLGAKIVGVFIYYCNDVKKRPQRGCSIQLVATETADAIMAISVQGNYVIEITVKININE